VSSIVIAALLHASLLPSGSQSYAEAHRIHLETGKPLVVLVGADWCPACRTMKQSTLPQAQRQGVLNGVALAQINTDQQPELARQLMRGGSIPQLIVYHKVDNGWQRRDLVGAQNVSAIQQAVVPPQPAVAGPARATPGIGR
jgi:thioredoxin-like negative regulator of GroEL